MWQQLNAPHHEQRSPSPNHKQGQLTLPFLKRGSVHRKVGYSSNSLSKTSIRFNKWKPEFCACATPSGVQGRKGTTVLLSSCWHLTWHTRVRTWCSSATILFRPLQRPSSTGLCRELGLLLTLPPAPGPHQGSNGEPGPDAAEKIWRNTG